MAGEEVNVKFGANVAALKAGVQEAVNVLGDGFSGMQEKIAGIATAFVGLTIGVAIIEKITDAVAEATKFTIEFNEKIEMTAQKLGKSVTETTNLVRALDIVGVSTDEYTGMLFRLERQVATNEDKLRSYGVVTRDVNGDLLQGEELMRSALGALNDYREGTDRNAAALEIFGRGAENVYRLMKLDADAKERATEVSRRFGVVTEENIRNSELLERNIGQMQVTLSAWVVDLMNDVIPSINAWIEKINEAGPVLEVITALIEALVVVIDTAFTGLAGVFMLLGAQIQTTFTAIQTTGDAIAALAKGDVTGAFNAVKSGASSIAQTWTETLDEMQRSSQEWYDRVSKIMSGNVGEGGPAGSAGTGGKRGFVSQEDIENQKKLLADMYVDGLDMFRDNLEEETKLIRAQQEQQIGVMRSRNEGSIAIEQELINQKKALGEISGEEAIQQQMQLEQRSYEMELMALQERLQLMGIEEREKARTFIEIEKLQQQHNLKILQLNGRLAQQQQSQWTSAVHVIGRSLSSMVNGLLSGTQTIFDALRNLLSSLLASFINFGMEWLAQWVIQQLTMKTTASIASMSTSVGQIMNSAATAAAGAYSATAAIPFVGPALAPAAAAQAYGTVASFAGSVVPFAEQGFDVPNDTFAFLHKKEMVLPADIAERFRNGSGGNTVKLHYHSGGNQTKSNARAAAGEMLRVLERGVRDFRIKRAD